MKSASLTAMLASLLCNCALAQPFIISANDEKTFFEADGARMAGPGKDSVSVIDIAKPLNPRIVANLPLSNSVFGPPTNLAITPDGKLAFVANPVNMVQDGDKWKPAPDTKLHVIDLTENPPRHLTSIDVGKQPSGMSVNRAGTLALVANRNAKTVSVVSINGKDVKHEGEVAVDDEVAHVAIAPDGKRAMIVKNAIHKVGLMEIDGTKVTYLKGRDMTAGWGAYNADFTPDGKLALIANTGIGGDGGSDTITVVDMAANPPRVIDHVNVGDGPEGFAISPNGKYAAAILLKGTAATRDKWSYGATGAVALLTIDTKRKSGQVRKVGEAGAGGLPEGVAWSADSKYLYVGNYIDRDIQIYEVKGGKIKDTGKRLALPGQPAALRAAK